MNTASAAARVLLVDDDRELTSMLAQYLAQEGFAVEAVHDGSAILERLAAGGVDLIVLDIMLPGRSGLDVLQDVRRRTQTPPVLMLTARGDDVDRIVGLELGADDYLPKPFNPRELAARLRAVLRRAREPLLAPGAPLLLGPITLDPSRHRAEVRGAVIALTGAELRVLEQLIRHAGKVISREQLTESALGRKLELYDRSIDTHVSNLRRKLALSPGRDPEIRGIRGAGYMLTAPGEDCV
ncbi:MAG TPA: response regulator transcription factor [Steroidobacteraceae bacterium]|nr:response regulator transcription factor [Steroidobacteraceae bacterium]